jgi:WD40 repeat protein
MRKPAALLLALGLTLTACAQAEPVVNVPRSLPTEPPPVWLEPAAPVSLETVAGIGLLGRLDNPITPSTVFDHAISPDGTRLAGLDNRSVIVWDLITGDTVFSTGRSEDASRIFFAPDKTELYVAERTGLIAIHDAETGQTANTFRAIDSYDGVLAYAPDAGWLAVGNRQGAVRIWDPAQRQAMVTLQAAPRPILRLAFAPTGDLLAAADSEGTITVWDWRAQRQIHTLTTGQAVLALAFAPDETRLAAAAPNAIGLWSLDTGEQAQRLNTGPGASEIVAFSPDGSLLISGGDTPDMQVWNPQTGSLIARLPGVGENRLSAVFSPDSRLLLTSDLGGTVSLWNLTTLGANTVNRADLDTGSAPIYAVDWTPDSLLLVLFGATGSVYLWGIPPAG